MTLQISSKRKTLIQMTKLELTLLNLSQKKQKALKTNWVVFEEKKTNSKLFLKN